MKRVFDLLGASLGLIVFLPVMAIVALLVWVGLGRPVLFRQTRPGLGGKPFTLLKFRTMGQARDGAGALLPDDQRLGRLGRILRSSSLDELPELFNVLKGDMSLVGPRPLLMQYLDRYTPEQSRRHEVLPGITGWAQVNGRNELDWDRRFAMDVWYVDNRTILLDLKIIALTIARVLNREGITAKGEATISEFRGTSDREPMP